MPRTSPNDGCLHGVGLRSLLLGLLSAQLAVGLAIAAARDPAPRRYSQEQLADGFDWTVFGREGPVARDGRQYVNKFVDPVGVYIEPTGAAPDFSAEIRGFVGMLRKTVPHLRIAMVSSGKGARLHVFPVRRVDYRATIAATIGEGLKPTFLEDNRCSAVLWNRTTGVIDRAAIFIVVDEGRDAFMSCLAEELTQALGPANDDDRLTDSLYNDSNDVGVFGLFDWYILASLYDPAILAGMTREEADRILPAILHELGKHEPRRFPVAPAQP